MLKDESSVGSVIVPSGVSTGEKEAVEMRDAEPQRYGGKGVLKAVENVNTEIAPELIDMDVTQQRAINLKMLELDGTPNKANLGVNVILDLNGDGCRSWSRFPPSRG